MRFTIYWTLCKKLGFLICLRHSHENSLPINFQMHFSIATDYQDSEDEGYQTKAVTLKLFKPVNPEQSDDDDVQVLGIARKKLVIVPPRQWVKREDLALIRRKYVEQIPCEDAHNEFESQIVDKFHVRHLVNIHTNLHQFLSRELNAMLIRFPNSIRTVHEHIMAQAELYDISSIEFYEQVEPLLGLPTNMLQMELQSFLNSHLSMDNYDAVVEYKWRFPPTRKYLEGMVDQSPHPAHYDLVDHMIPTLTREYGKLPQGVEYFPEKGYFYDDESDES